MNMLSLPLSDLRHRPLRSALTTIGIAVSAACFLTLASLSQGLERGWVNSLRNRGIHLLALSRDSVEVMAASLPENLGAQMAAVKGVAQASGELANLIRVDLENETEEEVQVMVRGWPYGSFLWRELRLAAGNLPQPGDPREIVIGRTLASLLLLRIGDTVTFHEEDFTVAGIAAAGGVWNDGSVFLPLPTMQELLDRKNSVTEFNLQVERQDDPAFLRDLKQRLRDRFPKLTFLESSEVGAHNDVIQTFRAFSWAVSTVAMAMALVVILNTLLMSVMERTREIGILCALGWGPGRILAMILLQGFVLAAAGSAAGLGLGAVALRAILHHPVLGGMIEPGISLRIAAETIGLALLVGTLGGLYPAWWAARARPVESLRHE